MIKFPLVRVHFQQIISPENSIAIQRSRILFSSLIRALLTFRAQRFVVLEISILARSNFEISKHPFPPQISINCIITTNAVTNELQQFIKMSLKAGTYIRNHILIMLVLKVR